MSRKPALLALAASAALAIAAAGCGSGGSTSSAKTKAAAPTRAAAKLDAPQVAQPPQRAADFALRDASGKLVHLSDYRGRAVLLTFIYDHCPDVCPLIVANLHNALVKLGPAASKVQVVAISVDPKGDTPRTVRRFVAAHEMTGKMEYLIGSRRELAPVWKQYGVAVNSTPDSRETDHSAFVYGITGGGRSEALYPANFKPQWIVHDVPLLASAQ